jgi:HK97 family phage major capsid protein
MAELPFNGYEDETDCVPDIANLNESDLASGGLFVPPELSAELIQLIHDGGCVEGFARHYPMKREQLIIRTFASSAEANWVGAQCVKSKDAPTFDAVELIARKLAVIVPMEDQLLEDMDTDLAAQTKNDIVQVFIEKIDKTFLGYVAGSPFSDSLSGNTPLAHTIPSGTELDIYGDFSAAISEVEKDGYDVTGAIAHKGVKHLLRNARDGNGNLLLINDPTACTPQAQWCLAGVPICFTNQSDAQNSPAGYEILLADFSRVLVGDRTGMQIDRSDSATLTQLSLDPINLFEQDMVADRYVMRKAFTIVDDNALAKVTGIA